jgi:thermostable 8-oxoguanine DNA glycosylase
MKTRQAFAVMARTLADEDAGKGATRNRRLEYEAALERVVERLGMTVGELEIYLWSKKTVSAMR